ncbi:alpha/beta-hydrolase [Xylariaceae sp. FL1651]|nr:alpha/beta-hydrolase [Xylariaceae sp. FL1651]
MDFSQWGQPSEEWLAFAKANPAILAGPPPGLSPAEQQTFINDMRAKGAEALLKSTGIGAAVNTEDYVVPTRDGQSITIRAYRPVAPSSQTLPVYVHYHGGGFLLGNLATEAFHCSWLAHSLSITVLHVCYRCAPQYTGLTAWHDALDGFDFVMANTETFRVDPTQVIVGGISAGGSLTATVVQAEVKRARETKTPIRIKGQILHIPNMVHHGAYPWNWFADKSKTSPVQCADAYGLSGERVHLFMALLGSDVDPSDPTWNPGMTGEEELVGTPQTALVVAGWDPLRDEGLAYAQKLKRAGVRTKVHIFPGLPHVFLGIFQLPSQKRWSEVMLESQRWTRVDEGEWNVETKPPAIPQLSVD